MMTFGSLFAGIGGFDLGLERAGMRCAWQVEIDPFCQKVLAKHWPAVPRFEDVRNVGRNELPAVDLICGGFPCQPHSHAGKRKGAADDRDLWPEYRRIIAELRPRWVIGENVPGIVTTILDQVLSDLESMGYSWQAFVIPAVAFDAPHRRDRVWIVANVSSGDVADSEGRRRGLLYSQNNGAADRESHASGNGSQDVAHTGRLSNESQRADRNIVGAQGGISGEVGQQWLWAEIADGGEAVADTQERTEWAGFCQSEQGRQRGRRFSNGSSTSGWWSVEPDVGRVAHGVSSRVERLRALGNAVVPQVVEFLGRLILEVDSQ